MTDLQQQRTLGIDPGLNVCGYGVVDVIGQEAKLVEAGVIRSKRSQTLEQRLLQIHAGVEDILNGMQPGSLALEQVFSHFQRPSTAILMGHARGVINLAAAQAGVPVSSYAATQIKSVLTGNGRAPKSQIQLAVMQHFNLDQPPSPHDVADALAIALGHALLGQCQLKPVK